MEAGVRVKNELNSELVQNGSCPQVLGEDSPRGSYFKEHLLSYLSGLYQIPQCILSVNSLEKKCIEKVNILVKNAKPKLSF